MSIWILERGLGLPWRYSQRTSDSNFVSTPFVFLLTNIVFVSENSSSMVARQYQLVGTRKGERRGIFLGKKVEVPRAPSTGMILVEPDFFLVPLLHWIRICLPDMSFKSITFLKLKVMWTFIFSRPKCFLPMVCNLAF